MEEEGERALRLVLALNLVATLVKIGFGLIIGSMALLVDGLDSTLNVATGLITRRYYVKAREPPDREHPYGHLRYEAYASIIVTVVMAALGTLVLSAALNALLSGTTGKLSPVAVPAAALSFSINLVCAYMLSRWGGHSLALRVEARHLSIDVAESLTVLVGVTLAAALSRIWDLATSLLLAGFIYASVYRSLSDIRSFIMDESPEPRLMEEVADAIRSLEGVRGFHALRARRIGELVYVDAHVLVDGDLTVEEAHALASRLEEEIRKRVKGRVDVLIHIEPLGSEEDS